MGMSLRFFGRDAGDFRFMNYPSRRPFVEMMHSVIQRHLPIAAIFAPDCTKFTNRIVSEGVDDEPWARWFIQTSHPADGVIVGTPGKAIAMFTADCPIIAVFDAGDIDKAPRLAVLHAGFRCLIREKPEEKSIIRVLFEDCDFPAGAVEVFYGFGIGPCCYGANHIQEVSGYTKVPIPITRAIRGPRKGQQSIDLYSLIKSQLLRVGVKPKNITSNTSCVCCEGNYHSNCRDGPSGGRNATFVWFE